MIKYNEVDRKYLYQLMDRIIDDGEDRGCLVFENYTDGVTHKRVFRMSIKYDEYDY
jgi:hypothetical protein